MFDRNFKENISKFIAFRELENCQQQNYKDKIHKMNIVTAKYLYIETIQFIFKVFSQKTEDILNA